MTSAAQIQISTPDWGWDFLKLVELTIPDFDARPFINPMLDDDYVKPDGMGWINEVMPDEWATFDILPDVIERVCVIQRGDDAVISIMMEPKHGNEDDMDFTNPAQELHDDQLYEAASIIRRVMKVMGLPRAN